MILPMMDFTTDGSYEAIQKTNQEYENYIYLKMDDKILKLIISIDKYILKSCIQNLLNNLQGYMFNIVSEEEMENCCFPLKMEYVGKFKLSGRRKTKNYKIPNPDSDDCSLIYVLNSIYNKSSLENEDLYNICYEKQLYEDNSFNKFVIEDVISKLNIIVVEEYDYDKLDKTVEYVSSVTNKENLSNKINLKKLKCILLQAEGNIERFKTLNLYDTNEFIYPIKKQKVK